MDLVFCGTPQFAVPTLQALVEGGFQVRLVVTQPERPSGRGMTATAPAVKQRAGELGLAVTQPDKIKNNLEFRARLEELKPQAVVVVAYGRIIPQWMIDLAPLGVINLHASLLPAYRGAAPIQWAVAMGESVTGATTMRIDAGLDTGDMLLRSELPILPQDTAETLAPRLAGMGAPLMVETLRGLEAGIITPVPQDHSQATLAPLLKKEDGIIDFRRTAREVWNRLRGFQPWPGAYTWFRGHSFHIWQAQPLPTGLEGLDPGQIKVERDRLSVACGQGTALELEQVQMEGRKRTAVRDLINGYRVQTGERFEAQS